MAAVAADVSTCNRLVRCGLLQPIREPRQCSRWVVAETLAMVGRLLQSPSVPEEMRARLESIESYCRDQLEVEQRGSDAP